MENSNNVLSETSKSNAVNNSEKAANNDPDNSESGEKKFIPLAAKDSEWVDVTYHKPKRRIKPPENEEEDDVEEEEEEMFLVNPADEDDNENLPIYALFPSLRVLYPESSFLNREVSTTDIAKSLVGEKPNFSVLKASAKLLPSKIMLESIQELPVDQTDEDEANTSEKYSKSIDDADLKEIGDASTKDIEDASSLNKSSKTEIVQEIHHTFSCTFPENQIKGLWYESNSENNLMHPTELIKKNITKTENNNPEI